MSCANQLAVAVACSSTPSALAVQAKRDRLESQSEKALPPKRNRFMSKVSQSSIIVKALKTKVIGLVVGVLHPA